MTKEEILEKNEIYGNPYVYSHKQVINAMQEYATQEKQGWVKFPENKPTIGSRPLWLFKNGDVEEIGYDGIGYRDATHFLLLPQKPEV